ncbi:uncharacterized protein LOC144885091 [Branchiostoma floridae x Branchiostoma japonicum]
MARFLFLLMLATFFKSSLQQGQGCQTVLISGSTTYQTDRMTTYTMTGQTSSGRSVYQSSGGDYLYYQSSDTTWNVDSILGSTAVGMHVTDTSTYADGVTGTWNLYDSISDQFQPNILVTVTCWTTIDVSMGLSTGAIVGIVVGVFFGVVLIVVVLCCCFVCAACKKGGSVAATPHNTSAYPPSPAYPGPPEPEPERGGTVVVIGLVLPAGAPRDTSDPETTTN